jgi:hypothetical protein
MGGSMGSSGSSGSMGSSGSSFAPKTWCVYGVLRDEPCAVFFASRAGAIYFVNGCSELSETCLSIVVLANVDRDVMTIEEFS